MLARFFTASSAFGLVLEFVHGLPQFVMVEFPNPVREEKSPLPGQHRVELRQFIMGKPVFAVFTKDGLIGLENPERVHLGIVRVGERRCSKSKQPVSSAR